MSTAAAARFDCPSGEELERDDSWWAIYRDSIPANERESPSVILEALRRRIGIAFRARHEDKTVGIATTHLLVNPPAVFLVYLAIHRMHRDAGVGGALFEHAWDISRNRALEYGPDPAGMIWEVDPPALAGDPAEAVVRARRISFFQRHGGRVLSGEYLQPAFDGGSPVPMQLMFRGVWPAQTAIDALRAAIYFEKYGAVNGIPRERLTTLLAGHTIRRND